VFCVSLCFIARIVGSYQATITSWEEEYERITKQTEKITVIYFTDGVMRT
jgi:hypothetical protein